MIDYQKGEFYTREIGGSHYFYMQPHLAPLPLGSVEQRETAELVVDGLASRAEDETKSVYLYRAFCEQVNASTGGYGLEDDEPGTLLEAIGLCRYYIESHEMMEGEEVIYEAEMSNLKEIAFPAIGMQETVWATGFFDPEDHRFGSVISIMRVNENGEGC